MPPRPQGTKLLVATLGLATVSYVGCGNSHPPGNLQRPPEEPTVHEHPPGNLMAPPDTDIPTPPSATATPSASGAPSASAAPSASTTPVATSTPTASAKPTSTGPALPPKEHPHGNLMAPPPPPPKPKK